MTSTGARARRKPGGYLFALLIFAICGAAAYWAVTTLFPAELQQVGQWLQAKFAVLLH